jgi:tetrahydromethanopterin S-methyltransferase subunit B
MITPSERREMLERIAKLEAVVNHLTNIVSHLRTDLDALAARANTPTPATPAVPKGKKG